jgi:hypothetical protein
MALTTDDGTSWTSVAIPDELADAPACPSATVCDVPVLLGVTYDN